MVKLPKLGKQVDLPAKGTTTVTAVVFENMETSGMVRRFLKRDVSDRAIKDLLLAATMAHSTANRQPWDFVIVKSPQLRQHLADATEKQAWIADAPVLIVICANEQIARAGVHGERGTKLYAIQDVASAAQNILLAANSIGLAASWVSEFDENKVAMTLTTPEWVRPQVIIAIGWPAEAPEVNERHLKEDIVHEDLYTKTARHMQAYQGEHIR
jgi:nitroreductase